MEKKRFSQSSIRVAVIENCVRLSVIFFILLMKMSEVTSSFVEPGQESNVQTGQSKEGEEELEAADIAAIVLGVLLLLLIIATIVVCILIKKGKIFKKEENKKVTPTGLLNGFSTTSGRMKDCSFRAITKDRSLPRSTSHYNRTNSTDTESIIYMYDDVYHPPNSRPLPNNKVKAEPYDAVAERTITSRRSTPRYHNYSPRHQKRSRAKMKFNLIPKNNTYGAPTPPPTPELGGAVIQNGDRIDLTTSGKSPYVDRMSYRY